MQVVSDENGRSVVEPREVGDHARERVHRLRRLEVADVLGEEDLAADAERDGGLHVRAHREDDGKLLGHADGQRREAAGAAQDPRRSRDDPRHAVVHVPLDRPVVNEKEVGHVAEPLEGLALVDADRLLAPVAARGDEREVDLTKQQMVERRRGDHDSELRPSRRDRTGDGLFAGAGQEDDGRLGRFQERRGGRRDLREQSRGGEIFHHEGEGLVFAPLAGAEP